MYGLVRRFRLRIGDQISPVIPACRAVASRRGEQAVVDHHPRVNRAQDRTHTSKGKGRTASQGKVPSDLCPFAVGTLREIPCPTIAGRSATGPRAGPGEPEPLSERTELKPSA